jgi:farnesyl-diphosphate farnesyltransferase
LRDTIEDDMTLPIKRKKLLLTQFHLNLTNPLWTFTESGPNEKDAPLLKQFNHVIQEYQKLSPSYKLVISDITRRMGLGMSLFIETKGVKTVAEFQEYMHCVAGLVGIGLTDLFVASGLEGKSIARFSVNPKEENARYISTGDQSDVANRMGIYQTPLINTKASFCNL